MNEEVMVIEAASLAPFLSSGEPELIRDRVEEILFLISTTHFFIDRAIAEASPRYRQIIPYVVIIHGNRFFVTRRLRAGNEARLHDKVSLGIGGHVNPGHDLLEGLQKELEEEVTIDGDFEITFAGIINDESTEVGRVHLGAVYLLRSETDSVQVRETEKIRGGWQSLAQLRELRDAMESWSQLVLDQILTGMTAG